jgi:predicted Zn-dependent protease
MNTEEKYELFTACLDDSLTDAEKFALAELLNDADAKKEWEAFKHINQMYEQQYADQQSDDAFIQNLTSVAANYPAPQIIQKPSLSFTKKISWTIGIAAMLMIGVFVFKQFSTPTQSMQQLYASNYVPEQLEMIRGNSNDTLASIAAKLESKDYTTALQLLTDYSVQNPNNINVKFTKASTLLANNQTVQAITILQEIAIQKNAAQEKAEWYLLLCYLQTQNASKVKEIIAAMPSTHFYYAKAQAISKQLP